jgi:hypothetical protein
MLAELYTENEGRTPDEGATTRTTADGASTAAASSLTPATPRMEGVPSEQLWRAAILAARQAALVAADLRRALAESAATPIVPAPSDTASSPLVS